MNKSCGRLVQCQSSALGDRVFYVANGTRHWVADAAWCSQNGFVWPDDVQQVSEEELLALSFGRPAPRRWETPFGAKWEARDPLELREIACSFLTGTGVEFGAASNPLPIPLDANVQYADLFTYDELVDRQYPGQSAASMIKPTIKASIDSLDSNHWQLDFIASSHVIEHVADPIGTIVRASKKLRAGGYLLLFVPDMTMTFDKNRHLTELAHLIDDYYAPDNARDKQHFQEFFRIAFPSGDAQQDDEKSHNAWQEHFPIHYHCWTHASFDEMIEWIMKALHCYSAYTSHPTIDNEFVFILKK